MTLSMQLKKEFEKIAYNIPNIPPVSWDEFRNPEVDSDGNSPLEHPVFYLGLASELYHKHKDHIDIEQLANLFYKKQCDYGPHNIGKSGVIGLLVRMSDKQERLINLLSSEDGDSKNEPIEDTYQDLFNYCIIMVMVMSGTWPVSRKFDNWKSTLAMLSTRR